LIPDSSAASQEQEGKGVMIPHQGKQLPPGVEKISYSEGLEGGMEKKKGAGRKPAPEKSYNQCFFLSSETGRLDIFSSPLTPIWHDVHRVLDAKAILPL